MIKFIDLDTNKVFNGDVAYNEAGEIDSSASYVHWFEDSQSVGKIYVQKICIISDKSKISAHINIKRELNSTLGTTNANNTVFKLLNVNDILSHNDVKIQGLNYKDITKLYTTDYTSIGASYTSHYYVHMLYFVAYSDSAIEAKEVFNITEYINDEPIATYDYLIGADFHDIREELKIGLGNFGVEFPDSIQKALYPSNVHDDSLDNILLNRKYKELLMNIVDISGNKGSYASLLNSLHWFEYPDNVTIKEFWRHTEWDRTIYNDAEFSQQLTKQAQESLVNYTKTTYLGLYCAMQNYVKDSDGRIVYEHERYSDADWKKLFDSQLRNATLDKYLLNNGDDSGSTRQHMQIGMGETFINPYVLVANEHDDLEGANFKLLDSSYKNKERFLPEPIPELELASLYWSKIDMSIKMALLGNFFETYFMPVHLDLIHSTIEDVVYTNAMKLASNGQLTRTDHIIQDSYVTCNIKDGSIFPLEDVHAMVNHSTSLGNKYKDGETYDNHIILGVDNTVNKLTEEELKTFYTSNYNGIGVIIPFTFSIKVAEKEFISKILINFYDKTRTKEKNLIRSFEDRIYERDENGVININFNLLCTHDGDFEIRMQFRGNSGQVYVKNVKFVVTDTRNASLQLYRLRPTNYSDWSRVNDYMFNHFKSCEQLSSEQKFYTQYLTISKNSDTSKSSATLRNIIIMRSKWMNENDGNEYTLDNVLEGSDEKKWLDQNYQKQEYNTETQDYYIFIAKSYSFNSLSDEHINHINKITELVLKNGCSNLILRNEMIFMPQYHVLFELNRDNESDLYIYQNETLVVVPDISYLKYIEEFEWIFKNASTLKEYRLPSMKEPFIAPLAEDGTTLDPGYYDIIFRYKLSNSTEEDNIHEITLNSAFILKKVLNDNDFGPTTNDLVNNILKNNPEMDTESQATLIRLTSYNS